MAHVGILAHCPWAGWGFHHIGKLLKTCSRSCHVKQPLIHVGRGLPAIQCNTISDILYNSAPGYNHSSRLPIRSCKLKLLLRMQYLRDCLRSSPCVSGIVRSVRRSLWHQALSRSSASTIAGGRTRVLSLLTLEQGNQQPGPCDCSSISSTCRTMS